MSVQTESSASAAAIRPFTVPVTPAAEIEALRARIAATRLPEKEPVDDLSQGVQLAAIEALARYWGNEYDFRRLEARLSGLPQFMTEIDGLDIHFIHVRIERVFCAAADHHAWLARLDRRDAERDRPARRPDRARRQRGGRVR